MNETFRTLYNQIKFNFLPRTCTARATEQGRDRRSKVTVQIEGELGYKRLRLQCERLSLTKVQDRLVHLLETEGEKGCFPIGSGIKSLAAELGVTHEALYRCIYALEKTGTLQRSAPHLWLV